MFAIKTKHFAQVNVVIALSAAGGALLLPRLAAAMPAPHLSLLGLMLGIVLVTYLELMRRRISFCEHWAALESSLLDSIVANVWHTDTAGDADFFNRSWYDYTGLDYDASINTGWSYTIHPDDKPRTLSAWQRAFAAREAIALECRMRRHDGEYRSMTVTARPIFDEANQFQGFAGSTVDVHELRSAERRSSRSQQRLKAYLESTPDGFAYYEFDAPIPVEAAQKTPSELLLKARVSECNGIAAALFGFENPDNMLGERFSEFADSSSPAIRELTSSFVRNGFRLRDYELDWGNDEPRTWLLINAETVKDADQYTGTWVTYRDITEHRRTLKDLRRLRFAVDNVGESVFLLDGKMRFVYANKLSSELFGYSSDDLLTMSVADLDRELPVEQYPALWDAIEADKAPRIFESTGRHSDGHTFPIEVTMDIVSRDAGGLAAAFVRDITSEKKAELAILRAERNLRMLEYAIDRSNEAILLAASSGKILYCNQGAADLFGRDKRRYEGMWIWEFDTSFSKERYLEFQSILSMAGGSVQFESDGAHSDGTTFKREVKAHAVEFEGSRVVCIIQRDISERVVAEKRLNLASQQLDSHIDNSPLAVIEWGTDMVITRWNTQAERVFEWRAEDAIGSLVKELRLIHPDHVDEANRALDQLLSGEINSYVERNRRNLTRSGRERRCEWHVSGLWDGDELVSMLALVDDISEQEHAREQLDRYREQLEEMVAERSRQLETVQAELLRQEKLSVLGQLTGTVSHELRNPLGTIKSSIYFIRNTIDAESFGIERALDRAERNIERCDKIIGELLDYARTRKLELQSVRSNDWLRDILREYRLPENIELQTNFGPSCELRIEPERLRRCMINIISNACEAMVHGNPVDNGGSSVLTVSSRRRNGWVDIEVKDTGPGIPENEQDKVLEPLYSTKTFGVGLGLPIVKQIIEQHDGDFSIQSETGTGTCVRISLPSKQ